MTSPEARLSTPASNRFRSARSRIAWVTLFLAFACGLGADLWTKAWAFDHVADQPVVLDRAEILGNPNYHVPWHQPIVLIPGRLLNLNLVVNRGAVFGLGENRRGVFIGFTILAAAAGIFVFARWTSARDHMAHVALGLILSGGIGNLFDRIIYGVVRDFLHLFPGRALPFGLHWPGGNADLFPWVFNIADVLLLTGMGLLMIHLHRSDSKRKSADHGERSSIAKA